MITDLRYKVQFDGAIPSLELITGKINSSLDIEVQSERNRLESSDYPQGVNSYIFYTETIDEIVEIALIEEGTNEKHIHATRKIMYAIHSLILSILLAEGGKLTYDSSKEKSWFRHLFPFLFKES